MAYSHMAYIHMGRTHEPKAKSVMGSSSPSIFPDQEEREPSVVVHAWEAEAERLQVCTQLG